MSEISRVFVWVAEGAGVVGATVPGLGFQPLFYSDVEDYAVRAQVYRDIVEQMHARLGGTYRLVEFTPTRVVRSVP